MSLGWNCITRECSSPSWMKESLGKSGLKKIRLVHEDGQVDTNTNKSPLLCTKHLLTDSQLI